MSNNFKPTIFAIDFDGTVVEHAYPAVGKDVPLAEQTLRVLVDKGHKLILWTMRHGEYLNDAIKWFADRNIPLYGVQRNPEQDKWSPSPKAYANIYIDDAALGCPLVKYESDRPYVDWEGVQKHLVNNFIVGELNPLWEDKKFYFVKFSYHENHPCMMYCRVSKNDKVHLFHTGVSGSEIDLKDVIKDIEYWRRDTCDEIKKVFG